MFYPGNNEKKVGKGHSWQKTMSKTAWFGDRLDLYGNPKFISC